MKKDHNVTSRQRATNLGLAAVAGQAGCVTIIIVFTALFLGLWLDAQFGQRGPFTFILLVLSIPLSLYMMLRITLGAIQRISPPPVDQKRDTSKTEEVDQP